MKQKLFALRTDESLYLEIQDYADECNGGRQAMTDYYHNADEISNAMEEERNIDLMCTAINIAHSVQILDCLDDDYFLVVNQDDFDIA